MAENPATFVSETEKPATSKCSFYLLRYLNNVYMLTTNAHLHLYVIADARDNLRKVLDSLRAATERRSGRTHR